MRRAVTSRFQPICRTCYFDRSGQRRPEEKKKKKEKKRKEKKGKKFEMVIGANRKLDFLEISQDPRVADADESLRVANLVFLLSQQDVLAAVSNYASPRNVDRCESLVSSRRE